MPEGMPINQALEYLRRIEEGLQAFAKVREVFEAAASIEATVAVLQKRHDELAGALGAAETKLADLKAAAERYARDDAENRAQLDRDRSAIHARNKELRATEAAKTTAALAALNDELGAARARVENKLQVLAAEEKEAVAKAEAAREQLAKLKAAL